MHPGNWALRMHVPTPSIIAAGTDGSPAVAGGAFPGDPACRDGTAAAGAAWRLPDDPTCARSARSHTRRALAGLRLPENLISDAELAVSELATNAWLHALNAKPLPEDAGPGEALPELWLYRRGTLPAAELVCGVFDTRCDAWPQPRANAFRLLVGDDEVADPVLDTFLADDPGSGRGLDIVRTVSHDTGCNRTRSRLNGLPVPGKVTWFTMKIPASSPAAQPPSAELTPVAAAHALSALLASRGVPGVSHDRGTQAQCVVSIAGGLTIRCRDGIFRWLADGYRERAFFDLAGTLEDIIRLHEDMTCA